MPNIYYKNRYNFWNDHKKSLKKIKNDYNSFAVFEKDYFQNEDNCNIFFNLTRDQFGFSDEFPDLVKMFACDLQWAKDAGYCGNQGSSGSSGTSGSSGNSGTSGSSGSSGTVLPKELNTTEKVQKFQDWLDANYPGWAEGYPDGKLSQGKVVQGYKSGGYGSFGPRTRKQWKKNEIRNAYLAYLGTPTGTSGQSDTMTPTRGRREIQSNNYTDYYDDTKRVTDSNITNDYDNVTSVEDQTDYNTVNFDEEPKLTEYQYGRKFENKKNMKSPIKELISSEEKNRILELHNKVKKLEFSKKIFRILNEQATASKEDDPEQKRYLLNVRKLCPELGGGNLELHRKGDTENFFLYKKQNDGLEYYYKPNGSIDIVSRADGKAKVVRTTTWYCQALLNQQKKEANKKQTTDYNSLVGSGWNTYDELISSGYNKNEISMFTKDPNHDLYLRNDKTIKTKGYSPDQQAYIDSWTANSTSDLSNLITDIYKINPTDAEFASGPWNKNNYFVVPNSDPPFKGGLKVYYDYSKAPETSRSSCRSVIDKFYNVWDRSRQAPSEQWLRFNKFMISNCIKDFSFGRSVNEKLNKLGGMVEGGVENNNDPWYIRLPRKL